jgi:hypothetical protein
LLIKWIKRKEYIIWLIISDNWFSFWLLDFLILMIEFRD